LAAGEALAHVLLRGQASGLSVSCLNQAIEERAMRSQLRRLLGEHGFPQLLLRFGYGQHAVRATSRRPLEDFVC
jgi:hypothetical protein